MSQPVKVEIRLVPSSGELEEGQEVTFNVYVFNFSDVGISDAEVRLNFKETISKIIREIAGGKIQRLEFKATAPSYPGMLSASVEVAYVDPKTLNKYSRGSSVRIVVKKNKEHIEADKTFAEAQKEYSDALLKFTEAQVEGRDTSQAQPLLETSESLLNKASSLLSMNAYTLALSNAKLALEHATRAKDALPPEISA